MNLALLAIVAIIIIAGGIKGTTNLNSQSQKTEPSSLENNPSITPLENNNAYSSSEQESIQFSDTLVNDTVQHLNGYLNETLSPDSTATNEYNGLKDDQQRYDAHIDTVNNQGGNISYQPKAQERDYHSSDTPVNNASLQTGVKKTVAPDSEKTSQDDRNSMIDALRQAIKKQP